MKPNSLISQSPVLSTRPCPLQHHHSARAASDYRGAHGLVPYLQLAETFLFNDDY